MFKTSTHYAGIMLDAFLNLLCSKLCWHNWRKPNPLPLPNKVQDHLAKVIVFSTLDLQSSYWQLPVSTKDWEKTAFCPGPRLSVLLNAFWVDRGASMFNEQNSKRPAIFLYLHWLYTGILLRSCQTQGALTSGSLTVIRLASYYVQMLYCKLCSGGSIITPAHTERCTLQLEHKLWKYLY